MFRKCFLISTALVCVAGFSASVSHAENFRTAGEWKVTSEDTQGYCTAVQPFSGNTFVTIGERDDGAMSMAFDFQKSVFQTGKTQSAKITAGSVSRTYSAKPKSESAIVLAVGIDDAFRAALAKSPNMTLSTNGQTHDFELKNSSKSLSILKECIQALKQVPQTQTASVEPSQPTRIETVKTSDTPQNVQAIPADTAPKKSSSVISTVNTSYLQEENERLKSALADTRRQYENLSAQGNSSARNAEMQEKVTRYESEIQQLKGQVDQQAKVVERPQIPDAQIEAIKTELAASKSKQVTLEAELAETKAQLAEPSSVSVQPQGSPQVLQEMQQRTATLSSEKIAMQEKLTTADTTIATLQAQLAEMAKLKTDSLKTNDSTQKIAALTTQLNQTNSEKISLQEQLNSANTNLASMQKNIAEAKGVAPVVNTNSEIVARLEKELSELKTRNQTLSQNLAQAKQGQSPAQNVDTQALTQLKSEVNALETENQSLITKVGELNRNLIENSAEMASAKDTKTPAPENESLRANLRESRQQLDRLLAENATLSADLEKLRNATEKQVVAGASGDWNLEQATRRYQEAQREIRRLGSLLEKQRGKCEAEKKDIEYMLFDPAIADNEQISQLQSLESELNEAKTRVRELEAQYGIQPSRIANAPSPYSAPSEVQPSPRVDIPTVTSVPVGTAAARVSANPIISIAPQQPIVAQQPIAVQPTQVVARAPASQQPAITVSTAPSSNFKGLLDKAGVSYNSLATNVGSTKDSTTWKIGNGLYGTARSVPVQGSFETMVRNYISTAESRCGGEFAAIPVSTGNAQVGAQREAYEIACINGEGGLSASLLFYQQGNQFVSIAHEGGTAQMEQAMEARDRLDKTLQSSS